MSSLSEEIGKKIDGESGGCPDKGSKPRSKGNGKSKGSKGIPVGLKEKLENK